MHPNRATTVLVHCLLLVVVMAPRSAAVPQQLYGRFPISDTLDVALQGTTAGTLVTSLSHHAGGTENRMVLSVVMADQSGRSSEKLELEETRTYAPSGRLLAARQLMRGAAGVNTWELTVNDSGVGRLSVTAAAVTTQREIGPVHENIHALIELYTGIFTGSLRLDTGWVDTAVELTSGDRIITTTKCIEIPSKRNDSCWVFTCTNDLLQRRELWKINRHGTTVYRDIFPYTGIKKSRSGNSVRGNVASVSLFDMMKVNATRPVDPQRENIAVSFDNDQSIDTSVAPFFLRRGSTFTLRQLPSVCGGADTVPAAARASYLVPTATLQCDHPVIKRLSDSLRIPGISACELVGRYNHWVYTAIIKKNSPTFSSALETLTSGYGDCGEHAVLLAALLRAAGIPARVIDGLIYVAGKGGYFYHAWVMAYAGGWVFADPSHDVFPALHDRIPLVVDDDGSRLTALAKVIGRTVVTYIGKDIR